MFAACCPMVATMVDVKAVNSTRESHRLWLQVIDSSEESRTAALVASGRLFGRESTAALVASGRLFGRELTAALVASEQLFRRESAAALKWLALQKRGVTAIVFLEERHDFALGKKSG